MIFTSVCMLFVLICVMDMMSFQYNELCYAISQEHYEDKKMNIESARQILFTKLHDKYINGFDGDHKVNFQCTENIDEKTYFTMKAENDCATINYYANGRLYYSKKYIISYHEKGIMINHE